MFDDTSKNVDVNLEDSTHDEEEKIVRCKECDHELTKASFAIEPHEHTFRNPLGLSFHILCYSDAPGTVNIGEPTTVATWFPEHAWSFAACQQCNMHVGWWYTGPTKFAALIATRVIR
ncbi:MAG: hypothetical protein JST89_26860 [Cyanobacteria bacterium SZAS-4]|nr:hypothetical protein [Cyanobacteria bacterium SZAS-4]